jgi:hypothetical protein
MTASTLSTVRPLVKAPLTSARRSRWSPAIADLLAHFARSVRAEFEAAGYQRAQAELERLGLHYPQLTGRCEALSAAMREHVLPRAPRDTPR